MRTERALMFVWCIYSHLKGFSGSSAGKESTCDAGDPGLTPGLGRCAGEGIAYPLQYSWASLMAQMVKNPPVMRDLIDPWVGKIPWRRNSLPTPVFLGFPGASAGKESARNAADLDLILGSGKIPWRRGSLPTPVFWSGESHGLYNQMGSQRHS